MYESGESDNERLLCGTASCNLFVKDGKDNEADDDVFVLLVLLHLITLF